MGVNGIIFDSKEYYIIVDMLFPIVNHKSCRCFVSFIGLDDILGMVGETVIFKSISLVLTLNIIPCSSL